MDRISACMEVCMITRIRREHIIGELAEDACGGGERYVSRMMDQQFHAGQCKLRARPIRASIISGRTLISRSISLINTSGCGFNMPLQR
jgi:hypothetical protein